MDAYRVLDVAPDASAAEITASYRVKVLALHPDTQSEPADPTRLADVLAAYATLRDPQSRAAYNAQHTMRGTRIQVRIRRAQQEPDIRAGPVRRLA